MAGVHTGLLEHFAWRSVPSLGLKQYVCKNEHITLFHQSFNTCDSPKCQRRMIDMISQDGAAIPASGAQRATAESKWEGSGKAESRAEECRAEARSSREPPGAISQETG